MQTTEVRAVLASLGADLVTGTADEFAERQRRERDAYGAIVREAGIRAD